MSNESRDHETRISRIEGILESVATKDFVREVMAAFLKEVNDKIDSKIDEQTKQFRGEMDEFRQEMREMRGEISKLNEKQHRLTGAAELIRFVIPVVVSVIALLVAVFRPF